MPAFLQASGGIYTNNDRYTALDFAPNYLKEVFTNIMGFSQFDLVRAQGTNVLSADEVWETADLSLEEGFRHFYEEWFYGLRLDCEFFEEKAIGFTP